MPPEEETPQSFNLQILKGPSPHLLAASVSPHTRNVLSHTNLRRKKLPKFRSHSWNTLAWKHSL